MIIIKDNLLDLNTCNSLINFFQMNESKTQKWRDTFVLNIQEVDNQFCKKLCYFYSSFLSSKGLIVYPDRVQIVKWPINSFQDLHIDLTKKETVYTSITYLNDNLEGGNTCLEGDISVKPKTGRAFFFNGKEYKHGVSKISNGIRYTLAIWYTNNLDYSI